MGFIFISASTFNIHKNGYHTFDPSYITQYVYMCITLKLVAETSKFKTKLQNCMLDNARFYLRNCRFVTESYRFDLIMLHCIPLTYQITTPVLDMEFKATFNVIQRN